MLWWVVFRGRGMRLWVVGYLVDEQEGDGMYLLLDGWLQGICIYDDLLV